MGLKIDRIHLKIDRSDCERDRPHRAMAQVELGDPWLRAFRPRPSLHIGQTYCKESAKHSV
jgi:hypothetical protein